MAGAKWNHSSRCRGWPDGDGEDGAPVCASVVRAAQVAFLAQARRHDWNERDYRKNMVSRPCSSFIECGSLSNRGHLGSQPVSGKE